jgi:hypothetical protein
MRALVTTVGRGAVVFIICFFFPFLKQVITIRPWATTGLINIVVNSIFVDDNIIIAVNNVIVNAIVLIDGS